MSERTFRLILGAILLTLIYLDSNPLYYAYIAVLFFEGITNWRIPILVNRIRFGKDYTPPVEQSSDEHYRFKFEAERAMRLVFGGVLIVSIFFLPKDLWFVTWIIASFLTLAGLVNFCPIVLTLRIIGFK